MVTGWLCVGHFFCIIIVCASVATPSDLTSKSFFPAGIENALEPPEKGRFNRKGVSVVGELKSNGGTRTASSCGGDE